MLRTRFWMTLKTWVALPFLSLATPSLADSDFNGDGLCDVWQQVHNAWDLSPQGDEDKDGSSNLDESIAGTNPKDPADYLHISEARAIGADVVLNIASAKGKRYQLLSSATPAGPWIATGAAVTGTGSSLEFTTPRGSITDRLFYKVETSDQHSDEDGISDWAEKITGTDPTQSSSPGNASGGTASDGDVLASLLSLNLSQISGQDIAWEKEGLSARLRLSRAADKSSMSLTLVYASSSNPDETKGSASPTDYTLVPSLPAGAITALPGGRGSIVIPAGASEMDILIQPVADAAAEVPELLTLNVMKHTFNGTPTVLTGRATLLDADPAPEANRTLFVAYLGKEAGVNTTATGIATALVRGDNDTSEISLTFSNLTSAQNTAYLRVDSGLEITNIGFGQVTGKQWPIRAAQTKFSDQAMLNALHAGQLYISVSTAENPSGEIRGYFNKASGSTVFAYNPNLHDAPAPGSENWITPTNEAVERDIWRFLDQCTYGGTQTLYQEVLADVNTAISGGGTYLDGYSTWLDRQINPQQTPNPSLMQLVIAADNEEFIIRGNKPIWAGNDPKFGGVSYGVTYDTFGNPIINSATTNGTYNNNHPFHHNRRREMWTLAMGAKAQVRQRMAQALSEILVISEMDQTVQDRHFAAASYWDMLADGAFGKYRDLLEKVTYSPMMGIYLSHIRNRAEYASSGVTIHPDENYAREIMQLFSIGLVLRHPDGSLVLGNDGLPMPTYDNDDITELARVMTGFCHGVRHQSVSVQRFDGLQMASASVRCGPNLEIQGGANTAGVSFTSFTEGGGERWYQAPWIYPMKVLGRINQITPTNRPFHDFGSKVLLQNYNGGTVLAGITDADLNLLSTDQTHARAAQDISLAHNLLAGDPASGTYNGHQNTPINISRWLIQRLTTSNPSSGYLYRVVDAYRRSNGNLGTVVKAILLDYEARSLQLADTSISHGRMKEPLVHFMSVMRALNARSGIPVTTLRDMQVPFSDTDTMTLPGYTKALSAPEAAKYVPGATRFRFPDQSTALGQSPLRAPSVFNWFLPDYVVPGPMAEAGIYAPEMQIASETNLVNRINRLWTFTWANLDGMATFPGSGVDDITNALPANAGPQVKVAPPGATSTANNFLSVATLTFTPSNWSTAQTVTVAAVDDDQIEGPHTTTLFHQSSSLDSRYNIPSLPNIPVAITDNEIGAGASVILAESGGSTLVVEDGATDTYTLRLGSQPTADVTIYPRAVASAANGVTQVTISPASVTFTSSNWGTAQTFTITAVNDTTNEGPHVGIIGHHIETTAPIYRQVHAPSLQATVADNEQNGTNLITITQTQNSTIVLEGGSTDTYRVTLRKAPTSGTTTLVPAANTQVTLSPSTLSFTASNFNIPQTVTVTATNDATVEGTHSTNNVYTASGGSYTGTTTIPVTVHDNDGVGITLVQTSGTTTATEGAALNTLDTYTLRLNTAPTSNVTVEVSPQLHPLRLPNHAKAMGYYASDLPASNMQKDSIIFDYADLIALYKSTFTASGGTTTNVTGNVDAHFAATTAVVDKFDLWWCGGQLKAQLPALTLPDLTNAAVIHPRKSIIAALLNSYSTTRGSTQNLSNYETEVRDRCRIAAYLVSISPQSFNAR